MTTEIREVSVLTRPARVAVLIDADDPWWPTVAKNIIGVFSRQWGGFGNVIAPHSKGSVREEFTKLLRIYDPDYLLTYEKTVFDLKQNDAEAYSRLVEQERTTLAQPQFSYSEDEIKQRLRELDDKRLKQADQTEELNRNLLGKVWPFHFEQWLVQGSVRASTEMAEGMTPLTLFDPPQLSKRAMQYYVLNGVDPMIALGLYSIVGDYHSCMARHTLDCAWEAVDITEDTIGQALWILWDLRERQRRAGEWPFAVGMSGLSQAGFRHESHVTIFEVPAVFVVGSTCEDYCLFNMLSRLNPKVLWFPFTYEDMLSKGPADRYALGGYVSHSLYGISQSRPAITSISWSAEQRSDLRARWDTLYRPAPVKVTTVVEGETKESLLTEPSLADAHIDASFEELTPVRLRLIEEVSVASVRREQFLNGTSVNLVNTPTPVTLTSKGQYAPKWIVEVHIEGVTVPPSESFADLFLDFKSPGKSANHGYRVSESGIHYDPLRGFQQAGVSYRAQLDDPLLKLPSSETVISTLLQDRGVKSQPSDKGRFMQQTIGLFGSLEALGSALRSQNEFRLLTGLAETEETPGGPGLYVRVRNQRTFVFEDFMTVLRRPETVRSLLDDWIERGILRQGLVLKCDRCLQTEWYPLDSLGHHFVCVRCGAGGIVKPSRIPFPDKHPTDAPYLAYILAEVIARFIQNNGDSVALALDKLRAESRASFLFCPELDVIMGSSQEKREIDIAALRDGKLIVGEVKTGKSPTFSKLAAKRLLEFTEVVRADEVVLCTSNEVSPEVLSQLKLRCDSLAARLRLWRHDPDGGEISEAS